MNLLIAIPCYGGMVQAECMMSLIQLNQLLNLKRIEHTISAHSDSLVTRVRNHFANAGEQQLLTIVQIRKKRSANMDVNGDENGDTQRSRFLPWSNDCTGAVKQLKTN